MTRFTQPRHRTRRPGHYLDNNLQHACTQIEHHLQVPPDADRAVPVRQEIGADHRVGAVRGAAGSTHGFEDGVVVGLLEMDERHQVVIRCRARLARLARGPV